MNDIQVTHFLVKYSNILYIMASVPNLNIYYDTRDLKQTLVVESTHQQNVGVLYEAAERCIAP
jgi:hypothetical protein